MVGKTPQVREIVYNVLDDNGDRTVIAKGATTIDVGDTKTLFTRTSALEGLTTNISSNVSNVQSTLTNVENFLSGVNLGGAVYDNSITVLKTDFASNVGRIDTLEDVHFSNSLMISNNFSNISILQDDLYLNIDRIDGVVSSQESNALVINGTFSNVSDLQSNVLSNFSNISQLQLDLAPSLEALTRGQLLQDDVADLKSRITTTSNIIIGGESGAEDVGAQSTIVGIQSGRNIGDYSIALGFNSQNFGTKAEGDATQRSIVINATALGLNAPRADTLVISPVQTDDSNTINIMGYNNLTKELVQSTLLRGIDGNVHATTNISVNNDTILFETNGNGSFGGNTEIAGTLEVGGSSSFTGAIQMASTLEIGDTSSFGGDMTIDANVSVYGESFIVNNNVILRNDGTGSFSGDIDIGGTLEVGGSSSFTGAMQMASTLKVGDTSSFGGDMTVDANVFVHGESFVMYSDPSTSQVILHNNGNSSFSGNMEIADINCRNTLDGFNSFRMIDGSTTKASINKIGESSFLGKMQINDELVVQGHSSFVTTMNVGGTSSFGDVMTVNSTSSFIDDVTLGTGADLIMNSPNFKMINSGTQKVLIGNNGNASFSGNMEIADINCRNTLDGFNSFRMIDGSTTNASINKIGESSFLGVMKIDNALNVDGITTIKDVGNDRIRLTPGTTTSDSKIEVLGSVSCWAAGFGGVVGHSENCKIDSNGNGSFSGTVTAGAVSTPSLTVSDTATLNSTLSVTGVTTLGDALSGTSGSFNSSFSATTGSFNGALSATTGTFTGGITGNITGNVTGNADTATSSGNSATTSDGTSANTGGAIVRRNTYGSISIGGLSAGYSTFNGTGGYHPSYDYTRISGPNNGIITTVSNDDGGDLSDVCARFEQDVLFKKMIYVISDRRIKDEITTIDQKHSLDVIEKLRPVSYKLMSGAEFALGYIGQEIAEIIPPAVNCNGIEPIANIYIYGVITKIKSITDNKGYECISLFIELEKSLQEEIKNKKDVIFRVGIQTMDGRNRNLVYHPELCDDPTDMSIELLDYNEDEPFDKDTRILVFGEIVYDAHAVDYNEVFVVVSSAVKELNDIRKEDRRRIETLENQVSQLLARVEALESN